MSDRLDMSHFSTFNYRDRIQLSFVNRKTGKTCTAKESLGAVYGHHLTDKEIEQCRKMAADPNVTEEQAEEKRIELEIKASERMAICRMYE